MTFFWKFIRTGTDAGDMNSRAVKYRFLSSDPGLEGICVVLQHGYFREGEMSTQNNEPGDRFIF
jgi:hypothetical protein